MLADPASVGGVGGSATYYREPAKIIFTHENGAEDDHDFVLDIAKPNERVLLASYGSGAGSDGFVYRVTEKIKKARSLAPYTRDMLDNNKIYVDYGTTLSFARRSGK